MNRNENESNKENDVEKKKKLLFEAIDTFVGGYPNDNKEKFLFENLDHFMASYGNGAVKSPWRTVGKGILDTIKFCATTLAIPAVLAVFGYILNKNLSEKNQYDSNIKVYTEIMSRREESENGIRKDMFGKIIDSFMKNDAFKNTIETQLVNLELLVYNFHESLNLRPLFRHLERAVVDGKRERREEYMKRLRKAAEDVIAKQAIILETVGDKKAVTLPFIGIDSVHYKRCTGDTCYTAICTLTAVADDTAEARKFVISLDSTDLVRQTVKVTVEVTMLYKVARSQKEKGKSDTLLINKKEGDEVSFWVGYFDFPMIDNTRLKDDFRYAVVLNKFDGDDPPQSRLVLLYFPGEYAGLKEKPFYQDITKKLKLTSSKKTLFETLGL